MWVELLTALIVEGYRELLEWWQMRPRWLGGGAPADDSSQSPAGGAAGHRRSIPARSADLADTACEVVERHGRKHVGIAVGIWWDGETWTFARGRAQADRPQAPDATTIFEIGSVTKVSYGPPPRRSGPGRSRCARGPGAGLPADGRRAPRPWTADHARRPGHADERPAATPQGLVRSSLRRRSNPYAGFGVEQQPGPLSQGLGWAGLPLRGHPQRMLWHNGGTGGFRSFAGFVKETRAGVVVLANSSRSVDAIGFRLLEAVADLSGLRPELPARTTDDRNNVVTTPLH